MVKYKILADAVVIVHAAYVGFVVFGFAAILIGVARHWRWVRNFWFRAAHLASIGVVALMAIGDIACPLTTFENYLRQKAGQARYPADFIGYWAHQLIFFQAPAWVFTVCYVAFTLLVIAVFVVAPPGGPWESTDS